MDELQGDRWGQRSLTACPVVDQRVVSGTLTITEDKKELIVPPPPHKHAPPPEMEAAIWSSRGE